MKHISLKDRLLAAMASATSQRPMETELLYMLGDREEIEAALLELYQARKVGCCKITRRGIERIVWWPTGTSVEIGQYGKNLGHRMNREGRDVHP